MLRENAQVETPRGRKYRCAAQVRTAPSLVMKWGNAHGAKGAGQLRLTRRSRDSALFWGFNPAVSASALKAMRATIRELDLRRRTHVSVGEIARQINLDRILRTIRTLGTVPFAQIRQLNASGLGDAEIQAL
jgi:hypothetical protein